MEVGLILRWLDAKYAHDRMAYAYVKERSLDGRFAGGTLLSAQHCARRVAAYGGEVAPALREVIAEQERPLTAGGTGFADAASELTAAHLRGAHALACRPRPVGR